MLNLQVSNLATLPPPPSGVCVVHQTFTIRAYCGRPLFGAADHCYWHSEDPGKYDLATVSSCFGSGMTLRSAIEAEIAAGRSLEKAYLVKAPLGGSFLSSGCDLHGGLFVRANLKAAHLSYCNLRGANFALANLEGAYLSDCDISGVRFTNTRLFDTKFRNNNFADVVGLNMERFKGLHWGWFPIYRMLEEYPDQCAPIYRSLASYFAASGLFDDASWAAYRSCVMRHRLLSKRLSWVQLWVDEFVPAMMNDEERVAELAQEFPGMSPRRPSLRLLAARGVALIEWVRSFGLRWVAGYGEKPLRVLGSALLAIFLYALIYQRFGAINDRSFVSCLYFSCITFTTVGYGDLAPHGTFRLVAASEALVGIMLCGVFLFCLGRRSVGRA